MSPSVSQHERLINALLPQNLKIDDRTEAQMLKFTIDFSTLLKFYDSHDNIDGDWLDFLISDFSMVIDYIICIDIKGYAADYQKLLLGVDISETNAGLTHQLQTLIEFTGKFLGLFLELEERVRNISSDAVFLSEVKNSSSEFNTIRNQLNSLSKASDKITQRHSTRTKEADKSVTATQSLKSDIDNLLPKITSAFHQLQKLYNYLQGQALYYLENRQSENGNTEPHIALLKVFFHLYHHLQQKLNELPSRHLDYYYNTILDVKYRPVKPDIVHLITDIIPGSPAVQLKQGMLLDATDQKTHKKYLYSVRQDCTLNNALIKQLKTIYLSNFLQLQSEDANHNNVYETRIYKADHNYVQPADFIAASSVSPQVSWAVLGEDQHMFSNSQRTMDDTDIGFIIAAPILYQKQGNRRFYIKFYFDSDSFQQLNDYFNNYAAISKKTYDEEKHNLLTEAFNINYTAAKSWETIDSAIFKIEFDASGKGFLSASFSIDEQQKPVDNYNPKVHGSDINIDMQWPMLRFIINNNTSHHPYSFFKNLFITQIAISVSVSGFRLLSLQNNIGAVSAAAPFLAFGPQPVVGAYLDLKNSNVFNKYLKQVDINISWLELPEQPGGFDNYYNSYPDSFKTDSFKADIFNASDYKKNAVKTVALFSDYRDEDGNLFVAPVSEINVNRVDTSRFSFTNDFPSNETVVSPPADEQGMRIELTAPAPAFGHKQFLKILPEVILHNAKKSNHKLPLPNEPYTPLVKNITLDFVQEQTEFFKNISSMQPEEFELNFFHIGPFENNLVFPSKKKTNILLLQRFDYNANLYLGLENVKPEQELSVFFELSQKDFSSTASKPGKVNWYFLIETGWLLLDYRNIIEDTTNDLMNSGIIRFRLPFFATGIKSAGQLQWLRASSYTSLSSDTIGIFLQAFSAERVTSNTNIDAGEMVLPAASITDFMNKLPGINKLWQPFSSFGGVPPELYNQYNIRVSEMLWHKNRPLTAIDIEKMVLDAFPDILLVKCILPSDDDVKKEYDADLIVLVFPCINENDNNEEPKLNSSKLYNVKSYLDRRLPVFLNTVVVNPVYERVKVSCKIRFVNNDTAQLLEELHNDIKSYLCPWLFQQIKNIVTGQKILRNHLLHFIESRPYVAYVTSFSILHFYQEKGFDGNYYAVIKDTAFMQQQAEKKGTNTDNINIAASLPYSVLIPSYRHNIEIIEEEKDQEASVTGLAGLQVGDEFAVFYKEDAEDVADNTAQNIQEDDEIFNLIVDHLKL